MLVKTFSTILFILIAGIASAQGPSLRDEVLKLIPKEFAELSSKDTFDGLSEKFKDKILDVKNQKTLFLKHNTKDNDVTIGFENGKFSYLLIKLPKDESAMFERTLASMNKNEKDALYKKVNSGGGHHFGKEIEVELPDESLRLKFKNDSQKTLRSVLMWNKGAKAP